MVSAQTMSSPINAGGKKIQDIQARNEAIEIMKLKSYLKIGPDHPRWVQVANTLMSRNIPKTQKVCDDKSKYNTFLQTWSVRTGAKSELLVSLCKMLQAAK